MKLKHISVFNLIEIFRGNGRKVLNTIPAKTHCEQRYIHDFYCEAERPFIQDNTIA